MKKLIILMLLITCFAMNIRLGKTDLDVPDSSRYTWIHEIDRFNQAIRSNMEKNYSVWIDVKIEDRPTQLTMELMKGTKEHFVLIRSGFGQTWELNINEFKNLENALRNDISLLPLAIGVVVGIVLTGFAIVVLPLGIIF